MNVMRRKLATIPQLKKSKDTWFIYFQVRDPKTDKMKPVKKYEGFIKCTNDAERQKHADNLIAVYTEKLKAGWSPFFDKENIIYSDQLEYQNFSDRFNSLKKASKNTRYFLNEYITVKSQGLEKNSISTYKSKLRIFCNWLDYKGYTNFDISEISNKIILDFFSFLIIDRNLDKISIVKYEQILKDYFKYLIKKDHILKNPVYDIEKPPKSKDMAACPISKYDLKRLLTTIAENDQQLYLACLFQYYLAIRPGKELRMLKINEIDFYSNKVIIVEDNAKKRRRVIDMSEQLAELCHQFNIHSYDRDFYVFSKDNKPGSILLGKNNFPRRFNKYRDMLNLPKTYKFYSMKHTGGGKLLESGLTLEELRAHFGHTSILSTDHYVKKHFGNRNQKVIKSFPKPF